MQKQVITSNEITQYRLSKSEKDLFKRLGQMTDYMKKGGKAPPKHVRLRRADFVTLQTKVREQSGGERSIYQVRFGGLPIISEDDTCAG